MKLPNEVMQKKKLSKQYEYLYLKKKNIRDMRTKAITFVERFWRKNVAKKDLSKSETDK